MLSVLSRAFEEARVPVWGVCRFDRLRDRLLPCRAAARLPENAQSVVVALFPYRFPEDGSPRNLSRYACVNDYHTTAAAVMAQVAAAMTAACPDIQAAVFCDNSPIPEVAAAALAGLGTVGDNGLLLNPRFGSFVFIAEIVTDLPLPSTGDELVPCCHCGRCAAACPAGCVGGADKAAHCLSAVTQKKGVLTDGQQQLVQRGGLVWGCDRCQEVCPANQTAQTAPHPCFSEYAPWLSAKALEDPAFAEKPYGWRGREVIARNLALLYGDEHR